MEPVELKKRSDEHTEKSYICRKIDNDKQLNRYDYVQWKKAAGWYSKF